MFINLKKVFFLFIFFIFLVQIVSAFQIDKSCQMSCCVQQQETIKKKEKCCSQTSSKNTQQFSAEKFSKKKSCNCSFHHEKKSVLVFLTNRGNDFLKLFKIENIIFLQKIILIKSSNFNFPINYYNHFWSNILKTKVILRP